jgi:hypothetical protein
VLSAVFQFVFGCRHRHLSRVFTIKHRTYKICFDCGREFDLPNPQESARSSSFPADRSAPKAQHARLSPLALMNLTELRRLQPDATASQGRSQRGIRVRCRPTLVESAATAVGVPHTRETNGLGL